MNGVTILFVYAVIMILATVILGSGIICIN